MYFIKNISVLKQMYMYCKVYPTYVRIDTRTKIIYMEMM